MKKMLSLLAALALASTASATVASCTIKQKDINLHKALLEIGKDVDISKAIDDKLTPTADNTFGITNYYIIGDSLSDQGGLEALIHDKFGITANMTSNFDENGNIIETTKGLGYNHAFTNASTAPVYLNDKLFTQKITSSNQFTKSTGNDFKFGRNYAVGGGTASDLPGFMGTLLNDATIDKQAKALVSQHKIGANDIVMMDIGGNDLFAIQTEYGDIGVQQKIMNQTVDRIKQAMFTLLNNGIKKVIFMDAPDVSLVPKLKDESAEIKADISKFSAELHFKGKEIVKLANEYYNNSVFEYSLYENFGLDKTIKATNPTLKDWFTKYVTDTYNGKANFTDGFNNMGLDGFKGINMTIDSKNVLQLASTPIKEYKDNKEAQDDFNLHFFFDGVHPTEAVHKHVSDELWKIVKEVK